MQEKQDLIIQHNFTYGIPKALQDKLSNPMDTKLQENEKENEHGKDKDKNIYFNCSDGKQHKPNPCGRIYYQ